MIPAKNYFSGSLGKLQNIGGSRFFTTPHTISIKPEYLINTQTQGSLLTCSLDGRLWLFSDYAVALKWNSSSLKMEFAKSVDVSNKSFIIRGIDWILTQNYFIQVLDDSPYLFVEEVNLDSSFTADKFYSFLPAVGDWQIIKNFLVKRYANEKSNALYSLSIPDNLYLTHLEDTIWGKDSSKIGTVSLTENGDGYSLNISSEYSLNNASGMGLAFIDKDLYGFHIKQDSSLCPVSADSLLYSPENNSWSNTFDGEEINGNIFFDPFYRAALAVRDNEVNLLPDKKIFSARGISQWFAPVKNIASVSSDFVIASLEHDILATHINSGLYRESLSQKNLPLTCKSYSDYKLSIGENGNALTFNKILGKSTPIKPALEIKLINNFYWPYSLKEVNGSYYSTRIQDNLLFTKSSSISYDNPYAGEMGSLLTVLAPWYAIKYADLIKIRTNNYEYYCFNLDTGEFTFLCEIEYSEYKSLYMEYFNYEGGWNRPDLVNYWGEYWYFFNASYNDKSIKIYNDHIDVYLNEVVDISYRYGIQTEQTKIATYNIPYSKNYKVVDNNVLAFSLQYGYAEDRTVDKFLIQDPVTKNTELLCPFTPQVIYTKNFYNINMIVNNRALKQIYFVRSYDDQNIYVFQSEINPDTYPI